MKVELLKIRVLILLLCFTLVGSAQDILGERERAEEVDAMLEERFTVLLPGLMDRADIDMWVIISREYNEDPVLRTMLPATWLNARRRTILVFYRNREKDTMERLSIARYNFSDLIPAAWDPQQEPDQWKRLAGIIEERDPKKIGLNYSSHFNIADGLVYTDYNEFYQALPEKYKKRIVSAEPLGVSWIETRTEREMKWYETLVRITHDLIAEAFSDKVITPGVTTTTDVEWWLRQQVTNLGLETWFHPSVDVQRTAEELQGHLYAFSDRPEDMVIRRGDLLHCDFGITYLRLNTDCQQMAYVLKEGEDKAPEFLTEAFKKGNRLQDILTSGFSTGVTGNQLLSASLEQARKEGLKPAIYSHPLGTYGHSAGTTIGMWDQQQGVPGDGDYPLHPNTVYAIELNTTVHLEPWKRDVRIMLEEAGFFGEDGFRYVNERQENLILIR